MSISSSVEDPLGVVHKRLAYLLCAKLATGAKVPWSDATEKDKLSVSLARSCQTISFDLARCAILSLIVLSVLSLISAGRQGWTAAGFPVLKGKSISKVYVAIPKGDEELPKYTM